METVKVVEPRSNVRADEHKNHVVLQGGQRYTEQVHSADSWGSVGQPPIQASWSVYPPSTQTIVDRLVRVRCYVEVESQSGDFQVGTNDAPRQFPLHSILDVSTVQINGESISDNIGDKVHALMTYGNSAEDRNKTWSTTCAMPDNFQQLSDWSTLGSGKNPLAEYGENSTEQTRGGFVYEVVSPTVARYVFTEPLILSPFYEGLGHQVEGFVNVNQLNFNLRWKSNLDKIWSHASTGNAISGLNVSFYRAPELLTTYITPDITQEIPRLQTLPYHKSMDYLRSVDNMAIGETRRVVSDSIKLSQIPRKMYLFVRRRRQDTTFETADSFAGIKRLSVLWNNQSGLFANATPQDLFEISRRNGCNLTYPQWSKYRGSVLCIEFGHQLGLMDNEAPGVRGQYTIQIELDVENLSGEAGWNGEFYTLMMMEGTFQISENMGRATLGNLTPDVVFMARQSDELDFTQYEHLRGGGFFSSLKSFINKVARGIQKGAKLATKIAPAVVGAFPQLAPVAGALPAISAGADLARALSGGRLSGGRLSGGRLSGGSYRR